MKEEEKIFAGKLFCPGDPELKVIKLRTHKLCTKYNQTFEDETEIRRKLLVDIFGDIDESVFIQGPMYIHYGNHTKIGKRFFGNFNLTIMDDTYVTIGDDCNFGTNVSIVTALHPILPSERISVTFPDGTSKRVCYAKPVTIGNNCWFGASVTVCSGVTIGDNCVIGAGSVVTKDIPPNSLAVGVPCKVIREINESDSIMLKAELF